MASPELNVIGADTANEGDLLWTPSDKKVKESGLAKFTQFAEKRTGKTFPNYEELWEWSVGDVAGFWETVWHYFDIKSSSNYTSVLKEEVMPGAQWFSGAKLNFAEHLLRHEESGNDKSGWNYLDQSLINSR
jgi:acetoacetyl-CoA synthetase